MAVEQRAADPVAVAAVAQLAVELVDEVAAVGEDQDAAGARGLDEAERGDGLAGAGGVLEPEALGGVGILGLLLELPLLVLALVLPVLWLLVLRLLVLGLFVFVLVIVVEVVIEVAVLAGGLLVGVRRLFGCDRIERRGWLRGPRCPRGRRRWSRTPLAGWLSARSAVSVPDSASTW